MVLDGRKYQPCAYRGYNHYADAVNTTAVATLAHRLNWGTYQRYRSSPMLVSPRGKVLKSASLALPNRQIRWHSNEAYRDAGSALVLPSEPSTWSRSSISKTYCYEQAAQSGNESAHPPRVQRSHAVASNLCPRHGLEGCRCQTMSVWNPPGKQIMT